MDGLASTLEAVVLIRAAPAGEGAAVGGPTGGLFCAALDLYGNWLRLSPVSCRTAEEEARLARWDRVRLRASRPATAAGAWPEAWQVGMRSMEITGQLPKSEQAAFLGRAATASLASAAAEGRSLALLRAEVAGFEAVRLDAAGFVARCAAFRQVRAQLEVFGQQHLMPDEPVPYVFRYRLRDEQGERLHTCADWELDAAFLAARRKHGEKRALEEMTRRYGEELPRQGIAFVMGATAGTDPAGWCVHGVLPHADQTQPTLF